MTLATTGNGSGDIERPEARCGFPGVEDVALGTTHGLDVRPRQGCDPAGALQEIQQRPLGSENRSELSLELADGGSCANGAPVLILPRKGATADSCHGLG